MTGVVHTLLSLSLLFCCGDGAKILAIFPTPSFSHQQPLLAVTRALAAKGHELTVITVNPNNPPLKNHRDIDVSPLYKVMDMMEKETGFSPQERSGAFKMINTLPGVQELFLHHSSESQPIKDLIREVNGTKFDLILYEALVYSCYLGFQELVGNPPIVGMLTLHPFMINDIRLGNPIISSATPSMFLPHSNRMTFVERTKNFLLNHYFNYIRIRYMDPMQEIYLKKLFGNVKQTAYDLERNVSMLIVSADLATTYSAPYHPNTVYVGPTHIVKPKPLPQDLQKWMDEAEEGVIYFSLGSNMKGTSVPVEKRAAFIRAFSRFPRVRVLWKWEADAKLPGQPDNVLVQKWLPQQSILPHPKLRLFISQAGLQSFQESATYGVPVLAIPMFCDQDYNARKLIHAGGGRVLEFADISYDTVYENLKEFLTNNSYKENMRRLSMITTDKPMPSTETAIWWIEYVMRHNGAPHLRPSAVDLAWYQYNSLDVFAALLAALLASLYLTYFILRKIVLLLTSKQKLKKN